MSPAEVKAVLRLKVRHEAPGDTGIVPRQPLTALDVFQEELGGIAVASQVQRCFDFSQEQCSGKDKRRHAESPSPPPGGTRSWGHAVVFEQKLAKSRKANKPQKRETGRKSGLS